MGFGDARQSFRHPNQPETGAVIAVQPAFRPGPDVACAVLSQRKDDQVLEPFGRSVRAETVLLSGYGARKRQGKHHDRAEIITPHRPNPTVRPEGTALVIQTEMPALGPILIFIHEARVLTQGIIRQLSQVFSGEFLLLTAAVNFRLEAIEGNVQNLICLRTTKHDHGVSPVGNASLTGSTSLVG
jgi:hypothetical protein